MQNLYKDACRRQLTFSNSVLKREHLSSPANATKNDLVLVNKAVQFYLVKKSLVVL